MLCMSPAATLCASSLRRSQNPVGTLVLYNTSQQGQKVGGVRKTIVLRIVFQTFGLADFRTNRTSE
jgi:hypothetical protein